MRKGTNLAKTDAHLVGMFPHRVILPVYIPNQEGYFEHALEILRLCLDSLHLSSCGRAAITVISNGCAPEVVRELQRYHDDGVIDQLVLNRQNRGKVDAVVTAAKGSFEELITISDSDVLFIPGWTNAIETIFRGFPECGFVSPFPGPSLAWYHTSATILSNALRQTLRFAKVVRDADLDLFAHSVGKVDLYTPEIRRAQMIIGRNGLTACVGGGHFVFTIRREVIGGIPRYPSLTTISGNSEELWLDEPPDRLGYWRLSTPEAYAYHMGNTPESWMHDMRGSLKHIEKDTTTYASLLPPIKRDVVALIPWKVRKVLIKGLRQPILSRSCSRKIGENATSLLESK